MPSNIFEDGILYDDIKKHEIPSLQIHVERFEILRPTHFFYNIPTAV